MNVTIYADGSSLGNPGPGGYGVVMKYGNHRKELHEGFRLTTNNRMELLGIIKALEALKRNDIQINIYTDSQYVQKAITQKWVFGWEKKGFAGKKNADLWRRFLVVYRKHKVSFFWVKGHSGVPENERCDVLAKEAAGWPASQLKVDVGYEQEA